MTDADTTRAVDALRNGDLVVYPTETVYGLGADATDADAVERVFDAKRRDRDEPVSLAVPDIETALEYTAPTADERAFMHEFLPGPVTVLVDRTDVVPDVLTAGRETVGVRVPDHDRALALLEDFHPVTATSANVSGTGSVREVDELGDQVREVAAVLLDGGRTPGGGSTVVDVDAGDIYRRGAMAEEIEAWL
ncbi:L-threonylcarbamoyladenylate synthase [Halorientalis sp.]|uniref:L-threonylcarbamoyladenylate synthase n=1 Tax=Halorientalis sp. TaxID=1931229 RepID=UPI00262111E6|nr:L-threonylcarbamoyladenylate synthase [Halorientalis sp.]